MGSERSIRLRGIIESMKKTGLFTNIVWKEGKYYVAQCLNVEVSSFGNTYDEALTNLNEALDLYLEDAPRQSIQTIEMPSIVVTQAEYPRPRAHV